MKHERALSLPNFFFPSLRITQAFGNRESNLNINKNSKCDDEKIFKFQLDNDLIENGTKKYVNKKPLEIYFYSFNPKREIGYQIQNDSKIQRRNNIIHRVQSEYLNEFKKLNEKLRKTFCSTNNNCHKKLKNDQISGNNKIQCQINSQI